MNRHSANQLVHVDKLQKRQYFPVYFVIYICLGISRNMLPCINTVMQLARKLRADFSGKLNHKHEIYTAAVPVPVSIQFVVCTTTEHEVKPRLR